MYLVNIRIQKFIQKGIRSQLAHIWNHFILGAALIVIQIQKCAIKGVVQRRDFHLFFSFGHWTGPVNSAITPYTVSLCHHRNHRYQIASSRTQEKQRNLHFAILFFNRRR